MRPGYNQTRRAAILAALVVTLALLAAAFAQAAPWAATATRPTFDTNALELAGTGTYTTLKAKPALKVTVCLRKRVGGRFFQVRCATAEGAGTSVEGRVSVPGCVRGTWSTTSVGRAQNARGDWVHRSRAVSPPFRCPQQRSAAQKAAEAKAADEAS